MWLTSISRRTPKAYFIYVVFGLLLVLIPFFFEFPSGEEIADFRWGMLAFLLPAGIIFTLSLLANRIFVISDVFNRNTLWPGHNYLLLIILAGLHAGFAGVIAHGLAGLLILNELISVQYNKDARIHCFNIGFCIGVASCFESGVLVSTPFLIMAIRNLKPMNLKDYVLFLLGIGLPFYFLFGYSVLSEQYTFWDTLLPVNSWFAMPEKLTAKHLSTLLLCAVAILPALATTFLQYNSLTVRNRRIATALFYMTAGGIAMALAGGQRTMAIYYIAPAFAWFASFLMLRYSNRSLLETIHFIFVGAVLTSLLFAVLLDSIQLL